MVLGIQTRTICDKCNHMNKLSMTYPRHHKLLKTGCKCSPQSEINYKDYSFLNLPYTFDITKWLKATYHNKQHFDSKLSVV